MSRNHHISSWCLIPCFVTWKCLPSFVPSSMKSPLTMRAWIKSQYSQTHDIFAYVWPKSIRWGAKKNWPMPIFRESAYHWPHFFGDSPRIVGTKRNSAVHPDHTHYTPMYPIIFPLHPTTSNCISWYFNISLNFIWCFSHYIPITSQQIFSKHWELLIFYFAWWIFYV